MKTLPEIIVETQALATVTEDQFEASLATVVADLQALVPATTVTVIGIGATVSFSDGSSATTSVPVTPAPKE